MRFRKNQLGGEGGSRKTLERSIRGAGENLKDDPQGKGVDRRGKAFIRNESLEKTGGVGMKLKEESGRTTTSGGILTQEIIHKQQGIRGARRSQGA